MYIPDKENFQPSEETLNKWLETRKPEIISLAGARLKPLFSDAGVKEDRFWFRLAMSIELLALAATIYGGMRSGGIFAIIAIITVFALIILDFVIAKLIHKREGQINRLKAEVENIIFFDPKQKQSEEYKLEKLLKKDLFWKRFFLVVLIIMAFIKVAAIFLLGAFNELIVYYIFLALYLIVVYVHYKHTGYYMAHSGFLFYKGVENFIKKEYDEHVKSKSQNQNTKNQVVNIKFSTQKKTEIINTETPLRNIPIKHNIGHEIILISNNSSDDNGKKIYKYELIANGVLTDDELLELTNGQEDQNSKLIYMFGRKLQLKQLS